ncbi:hypothetical protein DFJ73DRAFT_766709 [Zopfochytrium polystomum]|nr:hypothetical protein DFJ73DRAFT_766709 [Zopfochytrium polystomum]
MEGTGAVYKRKRAFAYELFIEKPEKFLNTILRGNPMWLSNAYNIQKLSLYMTKYDDHNFPYLETDEAWYGFKNGIYNIETCEFVEIPEGCDDVEEEYICEEKLGEKVVRKYFDINFRKTLNTENFDKVLKYQFNDEVVEFIYAMIGRMFGIRDKWDVMLYLLGESGCGKSVVLDVVRSFFDKVGNINETFEDKFGLGYIKDKDIVISDNLPKEIHRFLPQQTFQSMVSGGNMGQISRRVMVAQFENIVRQKDTSLIDRIRKEELDAILYKSTLLYKKWEERVGNKSIWDVAPSYFIEKQEDLRTERNPFFKIAGKITNEDVVNNTGSKNYTSEDVIKGIKVR